MNRSLVLAGGGMRVAWQAGVLKALEEINLEFDHVDGTSGGILTSAMVLSGLDAEAIMRRWRKVNVRNFAAPLPLRDYLRGPWNLPGLSSMRGMTDKLFPAMGVNLKAIHDSPVPGTFNICNFTEKRSVAVRNTEVDAQLLAAGMSLPIFMAPLQRDGVTWTDAAWIRDANITAALEHGAQEIWLVWCVGNSPYWGEGPLEQYVHMIEMSASGALLADFETAGAAGRRFVLHVVKPEYPLPLDPAFYLGRINAQTLMAMGYRDAVAYLERRSVNGVVADHTCTQMSDPFPGASWNEHLTGRRAGARLTVFKTIASRGTCAVTGFITLPGQADPIPLADGKLVEEDGRWEYVARARINGLWTAVRIHRPLPGQATPVERLRHATMQVGRTSYQLHLGSRATVRLLVSVEPFGVHGVRRRVGAALRVLLRGWRRLHEAP